MTATVKQPRRRRRLSPWWWLLPVAAIAGGGLWVARNNPTSSSAALNTAQRETATATRGDFKVSVSGPGTLAALRTLDVKPQVSGTLTLLPKVGDRVVKGQLVARLDDTNFRRNLSTARFNLEKAQASLEKLRSDSTSSAQSQGQTVASAQTAFDNATRDLETARQNLDTQQRLFAVGGVAQQAVTDARTQLDKAQNALESAQVALSTAKSAVGLKSSSSEQDLRSAQLAVDGARLDLQTAQDNLTYTKLYAPFSGSVSSVAGQVGGAASSGAALFTLIDNSALELPVQVDETEIGKVAVGQKANLTLDAVPGNFVGQVVRVDPAATVSQNIAYFNATVRVQNSDGKLRPGMTAEGEIISQELPNVVQVPKRAIESVRTRSYVQVLSSDGKTAERTLVRIQAEDGTTAALSDGLQGGETLVLPTRATAGSSSGGGFGGPPQ